MSFSPKFYFFFILFLIFKLSFEWLLQQKIKITEFKWEGHTTTILCKRDILIVALLKCILHIWFSNGNIKDNNRKIRKTKFIYTCGSLIGSKLGSSSVNTGEKLWESQQRHCMHLAWELEPKSYHTVEVWLRVQHSNSKVYI